MKTWQMVLLGSVVGLGLLGWAWMLDEPLDPRAQAWLEPAAPAESAAYYQLLGMDAPAGQEPQAVGRQLLQAHQQWLAKHALNKPQATADRARIELPGAELCRLGEGDCLQRLREDRAALGELLVRHGELLRRYETLLTLNDYRTLSQPSMHEPQVNFTTLDSANRVRAVQILALALDGRGGEALALLQQDVRLLRHWLARADDLLLKLMLVRQLANDLEAIAVLHRAGLVPGPAPQAMLSNAERSLDAPMQREFAKMSSELLSLLDNPPKVAGIQVPRWRQHLTYKPQMTLNDMFTDYQRVAANSRLETVAFVRTVKMQSHSEPSLWRRARNPVGTILGSISMPDLNKYLASLHDLDAKLALFNSLGQSVPDAGNPYRPGHPASWNAKRQAYCFSGPLRDERGLRCLPWAPPAQ